MSWLNKRKWILYFFFLARFILFVCVLCFALPFDFITFLPQFFPFRFESGQKINLKTCRRTPIILFVFFFSTLRRFSVGYQREVVSTSIANIKKLRFFSLGLNEESHTKKQDEDKTKNDQQQPNQATETSPTTTVRERSEKSTCVKMFDWY